MSGLMIKIWDVQHGSAAYVTTPNGKHIAIDLGVGDISGNEFSPFSEFSPLRYLYYSYGVKQLDELIITHPHTDHIDDINNLDLLSPKVLRAPKHIPEDSIRKGNRSSDSAKIDKYLGMLKHYSNPVSEEENPEKHSNNGGVYINTFHPVNCAPSNLNNQSIVVFITYGAHTICIPGDNENASWNELLENPQFKSYLRLTDVFVASHHGRESGFSENVFEYCSPKLVIISDGPQGETCVANRYYNKASGHYVTQRSNGKGKERYVLTTRTDGSIQIDTNGTYLQISTE